MLGERITKLAHLLDKIKPEIIKSMYLIWNTGKSEIENLIIDEDISKNDYYEMMKTDILSAFTSKKIFNSRFKKLSPVEQIAGMYLAEVPSGMSIKDIVLELSNEKGWSRKSTLNILKRLFSEYFCIPLKSPNDLIVFIPKEFRNQMAKLEDIDEVVLTLRLAETLTEITDIWRIKEICKNLGLSVLGEKKQLAKRIGQESNFDNLMTALFKKEIQDLIKYINQELDLNFFVEGNKSKLAIQIRKNGKYIINAYSKTMPDYPVKALRTIFKLVEDKELSYKNQDKKYPARKLIGYLYYSNDYTVEMNKVYSTFQLPVFTNLIKDDLDNAIDILYDLGVIIIDIEDDVKYIRLNPEFYKESSVNIEDYITNGTDLGKTYNNLEICDKFLISFIMEFYDPVEIELIEERFNVRFNEELFTGSLETIVKHNFTIVCNNKNNENSLMIPRIFRKKIKDLLSTDTNFIQLSSLINVEINKLYDLLDKKEKNTRIVEDKFTQAENELTTLKEEFSDVLLRDRDIEEIEIINEKNRLLLENSRLIRRNKELRNDLMDLKSKIIIYDESSFDPDEFRTLSYDEENKDRFADYLVFLLQNIGLSAKINEDSEGPIIIGLASAPDIALMIDFSLGETIKDDAYPLGLHFQTDEYIYNSELHKYTRVLKLFIANDFPENYSVIRLSKRYSVKLLKVEQLIDIFNIYNIMPIPQHEIIKLFELETDKDIFVKDWAISELNKLIFESKLKIIRSLLIYNELYKATDVNYDSRDAEGIYNNVKELFEIKELEPISEEEIKQTLENFSSPLIQMTLRSNKYEGSEHFIPLLKPDSLIKQIKFLTQYIQEISDDLIIDDI